MGRAKRVNQILIADSHLLFRRGLRSLLDSEPDMQVVAEVSEAAEALAKIAQTAPDILVMDLALLEPPDALAAVQLRQANPALSILFLTQHDGPSELERAVDAGARGYMLKSSTPAQLVAGIRQIASGDDSNARGLSKIVPDLRALAVSNENPNRTAVLTPREQEVVRLLAEGRTVREVAAELALSVKTVEAHKLNLMRKLDIHSRASLVQYAAQQGWIAPQLT